MAVGYLDPISPFAVYYSLRASAMSCCPATAIIDVDGLYPDPINYLAVVSITYTCDVLLPHSDQVWSR